MKKLFVTLFIYIAFILSAINLTEAAENMKNITFSQPMRRSKALPYAINAYLHDIKIGFIHYNATDEEGFIDALNVETVLQNKGIGTTLFLQSMAHLKTLGCSTVRWSALNSVNFYKRFGARINGSAQSNSAFMIFEFDKDGNPKKNYLEYKKQMGM